MKVNDIIHLLTGNVQIYCNHSLLYNGEAKYYKDNHNTILDDAFIVGISSDIMDSGYGSLFDPDVCPTIVISTRRKEEL